MFFSPKIITPVNGSIYSENIFGVEEDKESCWIYEITPKVALFSMFNTTGIISTYYERKSFKHVDLKAVKDMLKISKSGEKKLKIL